MSSVISYPALLQYTETDFIILYEEHYRQVNGNTLRCQPAVCFAYRRLYISMMFNSNDVNMSPIENLLMLR